MDIFNSPEITEDTQERKDVELSLYFIMISIISVVVFAVLL
jgi:hypothetical protein